MIHRHVTILADRQMTRRAITDRATAHHRTVQLPRTVADAARLLAGTRYHRHRAPLPHALAALTAAAAAVPGRDDRSALAAGLGGVVLAAHIAATVARIDLDAAARHAAARALTRAGHLPAA